MCTCSRRTFVAGTALGLAGIVSRPRPATALSERQRYFVAEAIRMRDLAVTRGDQPYGAVMVKGDAIVGYGASRVVTDRNGDAHAERVALWEAQRQLNTKDMTGAVIYATSRPCGACQNALALANVSRMFVGPDASDAGAPRAW